MPAEALHEAFTKAGEKAGIEIWRMEDFQPVPVPKNQYGNFYSGDSYIVLKTDGEAKNLSWDIHFWLGSKTSQDEAGTAAILSVNLDDNKFDGAAIQHRETQGHESKQFLGYFEPAIRYMDGGHSSGFNHVTINPGAEKRLFQIKGKRNVRVKQVDPSVSSMNKGDCFVLDVAHNIYVFVGEKAKPVEKLKAINVANQINDQDHNGRGEIEIIDPFASEGDVENFFKALGSGDLDSVSDDSEDDEEFERRDAKEVTLSEISNSTGSMKITKLSSPFTQDMLDTKECFILDTGSSGIYVWVGKGSNEKEKAEAMNRAQQYLKAHDLPPWVHVSKVPEDLEPTAFKQYFEGWN
ncbi:unnamed protein product [Chilo suppressalis]|uniref:Gelsolin-like domain-containing protein n=1 Tax=Chilo suppressalis TaxID=168631 RepID=A0ABN8EAZ8_CHISP|nr:unnamed protein product [Chilo suppressalis]